MSQRGNNEGSIYQRKKDGRWVGAVSLGYVGGKLQRKTVYGHTREEAARQLKRVQGEIERGLPVPNDRLTVSRFLTDWLEKTIKPSVRPSTFTAYSLYVNNHLIPGLGRVRLTKLTPQQVEAFMAERAKSGLSPRTVNHMRTILRTALNKAMAWGLVNRNVAALADPRHMPESEPSVLSPEQAAKLLDGVATMRLGALYITALTLGLRLGEALGLQWADVDLNKGTLTVRRALQRIGGKAAFVEPKSRTSRRTVKLPAVTLAVLKDHRKRQLEERLRIKGEWNPDSLVFCNYRGGPLNPSTTTRTFRQVLEKLELPSMRFHDLRHSAATLLLATGTHPRLVMELLGHSQISITMNRYSHVLDSMAAETADRMDAVFASPARAAAAADV